MNAISRIDSCILVMDQTLEALDSKQAEQRIFYSQLLQCDYSPPRPVCCANEAR